MSNTIQCSALPDVLPPRTVGTLFVGAGVPGGRVYGRNGCRIYSYAACAEYLMSLEPPVVWPTESALIIDSSTGSIVCRAAQLLVKGYSAENWRLVLNITGWDLQANLGLPDCDDGHRSRLTHVAGAAGNCSPRRGRSLAEQSDGPDY